MNGTIKFIVGGVATALMTMAAHSWGGLGTTFIDGLKSDTQTALGNAGGVGVTIDFVREPALRRIAVLSGPADAATRMRLLAVASAVPGVAGARWAEQDAAPAAEAPATAQEIIACQTKVDQIIAGQTIQFETGSSAIKPDSSGLIDALSAALSPCEGTVIDVAGHTDASGNAAANMSLSEERANAVVAALVAKGVPAARLTARGLGSTQPKVAGRSATANAANRRIEFQISAAGTSASLNAEASAPSSADEGN